MGFYSVPQFRNPHANAAKKELDKRYEEYKEGKLELYDWKDIHKGLRDKYT